MVHIKDRKYEYETEDGRIVSRQRLYQIKNRKKFNEYRKAWREENRDKVNAYNKKWRDSKKTDK